MKLNLSTDTDAFKRQETEYRHGIFVIKITANVANLRLRKLLSQLYIVIYFATKLYLKRRVHTYLD